MDIPITIFSAKNLLFSIDVSIGTMYKKSRARTWY